MVYPYLAVDALMIDARDLIDAYYYEEIKEIVPKVAVHQVMRGDDRQPHYLPKTKN